MKAILTENDRSLSWRDVPDPVLKDGEVLVKVAYAGVNRADLMQREGNYPPPPGCPEWMGLEISGTVVSLTDEARRSSPCREGDRVCALLGGGGYAEYAAVPWNMLMPVPDHCTMAEAAAIPEAFATSYLNLFIEGGLKKGDTLLVTAGSSGLASVAIPMAKAAGARVITTLRKREQLPLIAPLGADRIVMTNEESLPDALRQELENGHGVDVALDCLGGEVMGECLPFLSRGARWIMIAALAGSLTQVDLKNLYVRNIRLIGSTLRSRPVSVKSDILSRLVGEMWPLVSSGALRPAICAGFPVEQAEKAHDMLYAGKNVGKVVLRVFG